MFVDAKFFDAENQFQLALSYRILAIEKSCWFLALKSLGGEIGVYPDLACLPAKTQDLRPTKDLI